MGIKMDRICQIAVVVRDIEKAAGNYAEIFGMEMPKITETDPEEKAHTVYKGKSSKARAKMAFFPMGQITLELIEPNGEPSTWRDFLDLHGEGVHHIAFEVDGIKESIDFLGHKGLPMIQKGDYTGGRYAYIDGMSKLGLVLELLENEK